MKYQKIQWVEIDSQALVNNVQQFRKLAGKKRYMLAMVKANAYGHGMVEVSKIVLKAGADWLGVHSCEEGVSLRKKGFECPVLVAGYVPFHSLKTALAHDLKLTVYNRETIERCAEAARALKRKAYLHLKLETGTFRQGVSEDEVLGFVSEIGKNSYLQLEGISSHFANIEDTTDHTYAQTQKENFIRVLDLLKKKKIDVPVKHMSCTAAAILFPETYFDMVRIGIGLYGLWPSKETYLSCLLQHREPVHLKPVLAWKARIAQIKKVPKGSFIGYGCTFRTTRESVLAVLPVGYYDGYSRGLSNRSYVLIKGMRAPLRGRVAMDFIVADITDIPGVGLEDVAVLIGRDGDEVITVDHLASLDGTINYELVTRINSCVPRLVK